MRTCCLTALLALCACSPTPDCDDGVVLVEICNGVDDDCDGTVDEGAIDARTWYIDADADGAGADGEVVLACAPPQGAAATAGDCDDADPCVGPAALDLVGDGVDQDCTGADAVACFADLDADGFGDGPAVIEDGACSEGRVPVAGDCDDADPMSHPGAEDIPDDEVDQDCTGSPAVRCYLDHDGDGYGAVDVGAADTCPPGTVAIDGDCNDTNPEIHPGALDLPLDRVDQDCTGAEPTWCFLDADGDGFGGEVSSFTEAECPVGESAEPGDCDDGAPEIHPGATELVDDGIDQDCSGGDRLSCWPDADADGFGTGAPSIEEGTCPEGAAPADGDCDDTEPLTHPAALDWCDGGVDSDCDPATADYGARIDATPYAALQGALDDAEPGDLIEVCAGTYSELIEIATTGLTVTALDGPGTVVIDATGLDGTVVSVRDADVTLIGLTLMGGTGTEWGVARIGGGLMVEASEQVTLQDCVITGNSAEVGGGVIAFDVDALGTGSLILERTLVTDNTAETGGGVYSLLPVELTSTHIDVNVASQRGGGLFVGGVDGEVLLTGSADSLITGNLAPDGGGVYLYGGAVLTSELQVRENSGELGGGAYLEATDLAPTIELATLNANDAVLGGGVYSDGTALLWNVGVVDGSAESGGGVYAADGELTVEDGVLWRNVATVAGGAAWVAPAATLLLLDADVGSDANSNLPDTAWHDSAAYLQEGVVQAVCADGTCRDEVCDGGDTAAAFCYSCVTEGDYTYCAEPTDWDRASEVCALLGASLATINTGVENLDIGYAAYDYSPEAWWIGFNDRASEGHFTWQSGLWSPFTMWNFGEPNNWGGNEDCATTNYPLIGWWNDSPCSDLLPFVCEAP